MIVNGCLAGLVAKDLRIDTGADCTVVRKDYIPEIAYTGKHINLDSWRGSQPSQHKLARINIKVGSAESICEVAVADNLDCPALLGADLGEQLTVALMKHVITQSKQKPLAPVEADISTAQHDEIGGGELNVELEMAPVRGTRTEILGEQRRVEDDESASAKSECRSRDLSTELSPTSRTAQ